MTAVGVDACAATASELLTATRTEPVAPTTGEEFFPWRFSGFR